jgi:IS30 family transposase
MTKYTRLSIPQREYIEQEYKGVIGDITRIANDLGVNKSTISREVRFKKSRMIKSVPDPRGIGKSRLVQSSSYTYSAVNAQTITNERKKKQKKKLKITTGVRSTIINWLHLGWSPEIIANELKLKKNINIHFETIYEFIYAKEYGHLKLWQYLVKAHQKRRHNNKRQGNTYKNKSNIPRRMSISKRPEKINLRQEFGHWEADSVVSGKGKKGGLHTEIERMTRYKVVRKIADMTSETSIKVQMDIFSQLPIGSRKSVTYDNGVENHLHFRLIDELKMDTYFCHPYSSWEKGSNEHANGLYRRVFPKGTDFSKVDDEDIEWMVECYNNRPMKCLGFRTPKEAFEEELAKLDL